MEKLGLTRKVKCKAGLKYRKDWSPTELPRKWGYSEDHAQRHWKIPLKEKRVAPSSGGENFQEGKRSTPSYAQVTGGQAPYDEGEWQMVTKRAKKKKVKNENKNR